MAEPDDTIAALAPDLWWKLDEASGTTANDSAGTTDGTLSGGATFGATGLLLAGGQTALELDGVDGLVLGDPDTLTGDEWSIFLFLFIDTDNPGCVLWHGDNAADPYSAEHVQLSVGYFFPSGTSPWSWDAVDSSEAFDFGISQGDEWLPADGPHMVGIVAKADGSAAWIEDGFMSADIPGLRSGTDYSPRELRLGMRPPNAAPDLIPFAGRIQHVAMFNRALTPTEVGSVWTAAGFTLAAVEYGEVDGEEAPEGIVDVTEVGDVDDATAPDGIITARSTIATLGEVVGDEVGGVEQVLVVNPQFVDAGSVDGASPVPGPLAIVAENPDADPYLPVATITLWNNIGTVLVATLEGAFSYSWQEVLNEPGSGKFTLSLADADAALVEYGQLVRCSIYGIPDVFAFRVEALPRDTIARGEEVDQVIVCSGRGRGAIFDVVKVHPPTGVTQSPPPDARSFSFASPGFDEPGWSTSSHSWGEQGDLALPWRGSVNGVDVGAPFGWPVLPAPAAEWIWSSDAFDVSGTSYFRKAFTLASAATVTFCASADNLWTVYLDGVAILGENGKSDGWKEHRRAQLDLDAGTHTLAAVVENTGLWAGFLLAAFVEATDPDDPPTMVVVTDTTWHSLDYPAVEPGYTPARVLRELLEESQARGQLGDVVLAFDDVNDSNGDPWDVMPEFGVKIGDSLLDVLNALVDGVWVDWYVSPAGPPTLYLYRPEGRGTSQPVALTAGTSGASIGDIEHAEAQQIVNKLLVKYPGGYFTLDDLVSQAAHGAVEEFLTLDVSTETEARRVAGRYLVSAARAEPAVTVSLEPVAEDRPYVEFEIGDRLFCPDKADVLRKFRVLGITVGVDDMGDPVIGLELNRRTLSLEEKRASLLRALGSGVVGDGAGSRPVSRFLGYGGGAYTPTRLPTTENEVVQTSPESTLATVDSVTFTYPGTVDATESAAPWPAPYALEVFEVAVAARVDGATDVTVTANAETFDLNGGDTLTVTPTSIVLAKDDPLLVSLTSAGSGDVQDLSATFRYRAV